jgi:sugar diacid utilization regulator
LRPTRRTVRRHWFHLQRRRKGERSEKSIDRMKSFVEVLLEQQKGIWAALIVLRTIGTLISKDRADTLHQCIIEYIQVNLQSLSNQQAINYMYE